MVEKSPTEQLRKEHEKVLKILDNLEKNLKQKNLSLAGKAIAMLENEFSRHSLNKEEKALFPEFEKFVPRDSGPTGMMILEHAELVESINKFKQKLAAKEFESLNEIGDNIVYLLRMHIDKENNILFNMIDMHLSEEQKRAVLKSFKKIDSKSRN